MAMAQQDPSILISGPGSPDPTVVYGIMQVYHECELPTKTVPEVAHATVGGDGRGTSTWPGSQD